MYENCTLGQYQDEPGKGVCKTTSEGYYQDEVAWKIQKECPAG